jgi:hypothetical protein
MEEREYQLEHVKAMAWERDAVNRLYYGLWIVFLGGFVLSLHVKFDKTDPRVHLVIAIVTGFRVLAIFGTALNFWMQYHALKSLRYRRLSIFYGAFGDRAHSNRAEEKAQKAARIEYLCEVPLLVFAVGFLLLALVGSCVIRIP